MPPADPNQTNSTNPASTPTPATPTPPTLESASAPAAGPSPTPAGSPAPVGGSTGSKLPVKLLAFIILALLAAGGAYYFSQKAGAPGSKTSTTASPGASVASAPGASAVYTLTPASGSFANGATITVEVREDSGTEAVNAAQANVSYPADKLEFVSVDAAGSAFGVAAEAAAKDGVVKIARGNIKPVTGAQLIAKINFKAKGSGSAVLKFADSSSIISSTANTNVLGKSTGATYTIK